MEIVNGDSDYTGMLPFFFFCFAFFSEFVLAEEIKLCFLFFTSAQTVICSEFYVACPHGERISSQKEQI